MEILIHVLNVYISMFVILMIIYSVRHYLLANGRLYHKQKIGYGDIHDSELPMVTVLIPMHNEEKVLDHVLEHLLDSNYDINKLEIIAINDHSEDRTAEMLDRWQSLYPSINVLHRVDENEQRGKPSALNDALKIAKGEIILVFDADYRPSKDLIYKLAMAFKDPYVGAVMGRVIPYNSNKNKITMLFQLERIGGYQVNQQARYTKGLVVQYGGTVGGFRKDFILNSGGFNPKALAEDTELTFRLYTNGYKVLYDNSAECYEEMPETWAVRGKQLQRWSRGHNYVMFKYLGKTIFSKHLTLLQKIDAVLLLLIYLVPFLFVLGLLSCTLLFFLNQMSLWNSWMMLFFVGLYNIYGNFSVFYEISNGCIIDGVVHEQSGLPMLSIQFYFNVWYTARGFLQAVVDIISSRTVTWDKTKRFLEKTDQKTDIINEDRS